MKKYLLNSNAERTLFNLARFLLVLSIIVGVCTILAGLVNGQFIIASVLIAAYVIITGVTCWSVLKVFVNISLSLFNINDAIETLKENKSDIQ